MVSERGVLVVTGASRGIGAAVARLAGAAGYAVAVNYREGVDAARAVVAAIETSGGRAVAVGADVGCEDAVARMFEEVDDRLGGPLVGLVNNAAIIGGEARVDEASAAALARVWAVNVSGPFLCSREAIRRMSTRHGGGGGAIVNVSSLSARNGGRAGRVHYAASKGALEVFSRGLALEVAGEGIRVNVVAPGPTATEIHDAWGGADRLARIARTIPMRRPGEPEEPAHAVLWLLGDEASYVTGARIDVDGGAA